MLVPILMNMKRTSIMTKGRFLTVQRPNVSCTMYNEYDIIQFEKVEVVILIRCFFIDYNDVLIILSYKLKNCCPELARKGKSLNRKIREDCMALA